MAEDKNNISPEAGIPTKAPEQPSPAPDLADTAAPAPQGPEALTVEEQLILEHEGQAALFEMGEAIPDAPEFPGVTIPEQPEPDKPEPQAPTPGKVVDFAAAREEAGKATPPTKEAGPPDKEHKKPEQPRRGRPSKADKAAPDEAGKAPEKEAQDGETLTPAQRGAKIRKERRQRVTDFLDGKSSSPLPDDRPPFSPVKEAAQPPKPRDKVSRGKKAVPAKEESPTPKPVAVSGDTAPAAEIPAEPKEPAPPPRPIEEGKTVYIKLSELHPFHTFREHPFKVVDDAAMMDLVGTIKEHGVMTPATVRPEKDGTGYEIIAGHRRCRGSELAGVEELPCIVRDMTDVEAVREMKNSNKQRGDPLPSELAKLLDLEVEAIKHQGGRLDGVAPGDVGKRSVEIVGENNNMNYKKVMRYIRLNSLVPELLNKVDEKGLGFMPAVELSYIKPKNQRVIAVSIDGEQSSPSHAQAKRLRELDQEGKLNGDVIDGILSEKKKEDRGVIISMAELEKYFGKEVTPVKMKEQIMSLLDEWKEKQPPELKKPEKKADLEK